MDDGARFLGLQRPRGREPMRDPDSYDLSLNLRWCNGVERKWQVIQINEYSYAIV